VRAAGKERRDSMTRNLKILLAAAMALTAIGAFNASAAQAHTAAQFHCHVEPCAVTVQPHLTGTGATKHHVLVVTDTVTKATVSFTCNTFNGYATQNAKTSTTLTVTSIVYAGCTAVGQPVAVRTNGCHYDITTAGGVTVQCAAGKVIEVELVESKCVFTIGNQVLNGIGFASEGVTNAVPPQTTTAVTTTAKVPGIAVTLHGTRTQCLINPANPLTGEFTTGNTTATGFTDPAGTPSDAHSNVTTDVWWSATVG
jgi:hypothetical protein